MNANERETAWLERQRRRGLRPDVERYFKPDWRECKYWNGPLPPAPAAHLLDMAMQRAVDAPPTVDMTDHEIEAPYHTLLALKVAAAQFSYALRWHAFREALRCKYSPDQPRVPAGNPDGGQWAGGGGADASTDVSSIRRRGSKPDGHHFVPHSIYSKKAFPEETRRVFDEAKTGRLHAERHGRSKDHDVYSDVVRQRLDEYLGARNIIPENMTPDQVRDFVKDVLRSRDPRIRDFNLKIYRRELQYHIRRGPRRSD